MNISRKLILGTLSALVTVAAVPADAATVVLNATGSGWCHSSNSCNSTNVNILNNHYTGSSQYNDWFAFTLPAGQTITSAVLSIWNESYNNASGSFNIYKSAGFSYAGLASGASLGSLNATLASTGISQYVDVQLNSLGLAQLNAASGTFVFGGSLSGSGEFAGYNNGNPAARLTLQTAVPEPATWAMMFLGMGAIGFAMRRSRKSTVNTNVSFA